MTGWKSIEDNPPKDGRSVLLWARLSSYPPEPNDHFPIVGFWHRAIMQWKVAPEQLNAQETLIATKWVPIPPAPVAAL
jgi:hypothetical protein